MVVYWWFTPVKSVQRSPKQQTQGYCIPIPIKLAELVQIDKEATIDHELMRQVQTSTLSSLSLRCPKRPAKPNAEDLLLCPCPSSHPLLKHPWLGVPSWMLHGTFSHRLHHHLRQAICHCLCARRHSCFPALQDRNLDWNCTESKQISFWQLSSHKSQVNPIISLR